jgi:hypothetical protein
MSDYPDAERAIDHVYQELANEWSKQVASILALRAGDTKAASPLSSLDIGFFT